jgi:serine/threonine protein kinase
MTTPPLVPDIPGYRDVTLISSGSTSLVFRAVQTRLARTVAIKVLLVDEDAITQSQYQRELETTVLLSSQPHIVGIIDTGTTIAGNPYIVMEYCPGGSYGQILKQRGPLPPDEVVDVGTKIAEALQAAHDVGVLHRDVKPSNILRSAFGPALADFGIARAPHQLSGTASLDRLTPHHASPEAMRKDSQSPASDLYSLASTMWHLLAGRPPFAAAAGGSQDLQELLKRVLDEPPPRVPRPDVPDWLQRELQRALAKDPRQRHPSAYTFAEILRYHAYRTPAEETSAPPTAPSADALSSDGFSSTGSSSGGWSSTGLSSGGLSSTGGPSSGGLSSTGSSSTGLSPVPQFPPQFPVAPQSAPNAPQSPPATPYPPAASHVSAPPFFSAPPAPPDVSAPPPFSAAPPVSAPPHPSAPTPATQFPANPPFAPSPPAAGWPSAPTTAPRDAFRWPQAAPTRREDALPEPPAPMLDPAAMQAATASTIVWNERPAAQPPAEPGESGTDAARPAPQFAEPPADEPPFGDRAARESALTQPTHARPAMTPPAPSQVQPPVSAPPSPWYPTGQTSAPPAPADHPVPPPTHPLSPTPPTAAPLSSPSLSSPSLSSPSLSSPSLSGPPVSSPPVSSPPMSGPPFSSPPLSGPPFSSPPMSGSPFSSPPMSGPPVSSPPFSAPPFSAPPRSGPPVPGPPHNPAHQVQNPARYDVPPHPGIAGQHGGPFTPAPFTPAPQRYAPPTSPPGAPTAAWDGESRPPRRWKLVAIAAVSLLVVLVAVGVVVGLHNGPSGNTIAIDSPSPSATRNLGVTSDGAPTDVKLTDNGATVTLTWTDPSGGTVQTAVLGGPKGTQPHLLLTLLPGTPSTYTQHGVNTAVDYCYIVAAFYSASGANVVADSPQVCTHRIG